MIETIPTCTCRVPSCPALATHILLTHTATHGEGWRRTVTLASEAPGVFSKAPLLGSPDVYTTPVPYYCLVHAKAKETR